VAAGNAIGIQKAPSSSSERSRIVGLEESTSLRGARRRLLNVFECIEQAFF